MRIDDRQIKKFIIDSGLLSEKDIALAEKKAKDKKTSLKEVILNDGKISEDEMRKMEAYVLGIPFVNLGEEKIDFSVLSLIPEPIARKHNIVAFRKKGNDLEVAMLDTDDLGAIDFVKKKVGLKILPRLTDSFSVKSVLLQYQKSLKAEFGDIIQKEAASMKKSAGGGEEVSATDLKKIAEDLPVVRIVDTLLSHAILQNASDIHIEPQEKELIVRYRIDGILHDAMVLPKDAASGITARIKVLSNLKLDEKRLPQDGRFKIENESGKVSFRVSTLPTYYGEKTVMRLLKESGGAFTLEGLGFHGEGLERIHNAIRQKTGIVLATGPTGSGKTTTLYTVLDILNTPDVNISTIEDPIEYQIARINQTQVKPEIGLTFGSGLRTLLRQDPNIIMVGEIRDSETASLAVNASLTGHLVLSTLHTNSASGAVPRLLDMGAEAFLLVSTIKVIVAQRLVRQLCKDKQKYILSKSEMENLSRRLDMVKLLEILKKENVVGPKDTWESIPFYKPVKTPACESGYSGRIGIHEILKMSPTVSELVMKGATAQAIEEQGRQEGMMTMLEDGIYKAVRGITTIEEVFRVISE